MIPLTPVIGIPGSSFLNEFEFKSDCSGFMVGRSPDLSITPYLLADSPDIGRERQNTIQINPFINFE